MRQQIQCEHGHIIIGRFDKIVHSAEPWEENCGFMNFNPKKKVLEHFLKHGTKYYCQFENNNSPSGSFFCMLGKVLHNGMLNILINTLELY